MVPTLNKQELVNRINGADAQERISDAAKLAAGETYNKVIRKRKFSGATSTENRLKMKIGKQMNSQIRPEEKEVSQNA